MDLLRARYITHRYARHAHETYTIALIEAGVEEFEHGRSLLRAGPGAVALLEPDVVHTGQAGPGRLVLPGAVPGVRVLKEVAADLAGPGTPFPGDGGGRPAQRRAWSGRRTWRRSTVIRWPPPAC